MTIFTVDRLREEIMRKLSGKRLAHVLSVEREIEWLGKKLLPHELLRLKTAALLHDNTKDIPDSEQAALLPSSPRLQERKVNIFQALCRPSTVMHAKEYACDAEKIIERAQGDPEDRGVKIKPRQRRLRDCHDNSTKNP